MKFIKCMLFIALGLFWCTMTNASLLWFQQPTDFNDFIRSVALEAWWKNISSKTIHAALSNIQPVEFPSRVCKNCKHMKPGFQGYIDFAIPPSKVQHGKEHFKEDRTLLRVIGQHYHVAPQYIVALWGLETDYGRLQGSYPEVATLATLGYYSHRPRLFRGELISALKILDQHIIKLNEMKGSWAGAMGQCQFLPSAYLSYAVDYDHSGQRDIWHNKSDVFASIANYLHHLHWNNQHPVLLQVRLPKNFYQQWRGGVAPQMAASAWNKYGVRAQSGKLLPKDKSLTTIVSPAGVKKPAYLVYVDNYRAVYRWNHSKNFVFSVGILANRIRWS